MLLRIMGRIYLLNIYDIFLADDSDGVNVLNNSSAVRQDQQLQYEQAVTLTIYLLNNGMCILFKSLRSCVGLSINDYYSSTGLTQ